MTLHRIVAALGGDLYAGGRRANVPAPGHSARDRSVSLLLDADRLVIHGFGACDWRAVRADLLRRGLIDATSRLIGTPPALAWALRAGSSPRPDRRARLAAARQIWDGAGTLVEGCLSHRHLVGRAIPAHPGDLSDLRHHPAAPVSVFRPQGLTRPALVARISDPAGDLTAVELVYLAPNGRLASGLRLPRKTVGTLPPGSAVRLSPAAETLLVGEGVMTVLSASIHFGLPAWALLSARNLSTWTAPPGVGRSTETDDTIASRPAGEASRSALNARVVFRSVVTTCSCKNA